MSGERQLVKGSSNPAQQHECARGTGFGECGDFRVAGIIGKDRKDLVELVQEVVTALPELLAAYCATEDADLSRVRQLTEQCFAAAKGETPAPQPALNGAGDTDNNNVASLAPAANSDDVVVPMPATEPLAH